MKFQDIGAVFLIYFALAYTTAAMNRVVCYYEGLYPAGDIDINICTHINYAFLGIKDDGTLTLEDGDGVLKSLSSLKSRNSNLKLLISVGGWDQGSTAFSRVAASSQAKNSFAHGVLYYMQTYKFDGVDIDWEYPAQRGGVGADKENFLDMINVIRRVLNQNGGGLISVAVSSETTSSSYNIPAISQAVDFINVMTYDFHEGSDGKTGDNAPLYSSSGESVDSSIKSWLQNKADRQKLNLGLAFYGHTFKLKNPNNNEVGAPAGPGKNDGEMGYSDICKLKGWTHKWDEKGNVPYEYSGDQWISYDNVQSIALKVQYAKKQNLGGVMIWSVDQDDKNGACGPKNPLLNAVKSNL